MLSFIAFAVVALGQTQPIDHSLASRYFAEAKWLAEDEGGRLWGVSLYGPMLFVDPRTRTVVANEPDKEGKLRQVGSIWTGTLPENIIIANTGVDWAGVRWAMFMWPTQRSFTSERYRLLVHENFHRIQPQIKLDVSSGANNHLDTEQGRTWLRIECAALATALKSKNADERKQAISDALQFRVFRHSLFPEAATAERLMELNEGLAEYTGIKVRGTFPQETRWHLGERLQGIAARRPTFAYSFAYETGPAYGLLLDLYKENWTKSVTRETDLARDLAIAVGNSYPEPDRDTALESAARYNGDSILAEEAERAAKKAAATADFKARLVDGPVLVLPLENPNFGFDPNTVTPLDPLGTVYPSLVMNADWGKITVEETGILMMKDFRTAHVAAPTRGRLEGPGWKLELKPGWSVAPGTRKGDFTLKKSKPQ